MKKDSKFNDSISVSWGDILKGLRWCLTLKRLTAEKSINCVYRDIEHRYPDLFDVHFNKALYDCEQVFFYDNLIRSLREFLKYKQSSKQRQDIQMCFNFYCKYKKIPVEMAWRRSLQGAKCDNR